MAVFPRTPLRIGPRGPLNSRMGGSIPGYEVGPKYRARAVETSLTTFRTRPGRAWGRRPPPSPDGVEGWGRGMGRVLTTFRTRPGHAPDAPVKPAKSLKLLGSVFSHTSVVGERHRATQSRPRLRMKPRTVRSRSRPEMQIEIRPARDGEVGRDEPQWDGGPGIRSGRGRRGKVAWGAPRPRPRRGNEPPEAGTASRDGEAVLRSVLRRAAQRMAGGRPSPAGGYFPLRGRGRSNSPRDLADPAPPGPETRTSIPLGLVVRFAHSHRPTSPS